MRPKGDRRRSAAALVGVTALTLLLAACGSAASKPASASSGKSKAPPVQIKVAIPAYNMALSPVALAQQKGYYAKHGLHVTVVRLNGSTVTSAAMESGNIQFEVTGSAPFLLSVTKSMPFIAIAPIDQGFTSQVVVAKSYLAKHPLPTGASVAQRMAVLDGATVAGVSSSDRSTIDYLLQYAHLPKNAIKIVAVANQVAGIAALQHGEVDAMVLSPPQSFAAVAAGYAEVLLNTRDVAAMAQLPYDVAATTQAYAAAHPATVRAFLASLEQAIQDVASRSSAVLAYEKTVYPTVPPAVVRQTLNFIHMTPDQPMTAAEWHNLEQFMLFSGQLTHPYTPTQGVDWTNKFLPSGGASAG